MTDGRSDVGLLFRGESRDILGPGISKVSGGFVIALADIEPRSRAHVRRYGDQHVCHVGLAWT